MSYPPKHHQDDHMNHMIEVIKAYPLATLISVKNDIPYITHLPLIYQEDHKLIGHIDKFNPHAELLCNSNDAIIIFSGPQCYISPSIYTTTQLPTWNYIKVHLKGKVTAIENPEKIKRTMVNMTTYLEQPEHKYELTMDNKRMDGAINYVKGFEIQITHWEGKFKLSQDKKTQDKKNARHELLKKSQESIDSFLDKIFPL